MQWEPTDDLFEVRHFPTSPCLNNLLFHFWLGENCFSRSGQLHFTGVFFLAGAQIRWASGIAEYC